MKINVATKSSILRYLHARHLASDLLFLAAAFFAAFVVIFFFIFFFCQVIQTDHPNNKNKPNTEYRIITLCVHLPFDSVEAAFSRGRILNACHTVIHSCRRVIPIARNARSALASTNVDHPAHKKRALKMSMKFVLLCCRCLCDASDGVDDNFYLFDD